MPRSDRSLIAPAIIGLVATSFGLGALVSLNEADTERYQSYRYAADKPQDIDPAAPRPSPQSLEYREPCEQPKGRDESDLCAQWRAAKAGEQSALWAKWSFWIGLAGLFGLLASLYYTRKAVQAATDATKDADEALRIARRNADAADRQVELSADTAKRELRAYVLCDDTVTNMTGYDNGVLISYDIDIHWKNSGSTPATNMKFQVGYFISKIGIPKNYNYSIKDAIGTESKVVGPGGVAVMTISIPVADMKIAQGWETYFFSWVEYDDAFQENRRRSEVCFKVIVGGAVPTKGTGVHYLNAGPFNGMDEGCHMPLQTKGQSKN